MSPRVQLLIPDNFRIHRYARSHIKAGWPIIPLAPKGKNPLNPGGCNAPISRLEDFNVFIEAHPRLNFGIVTGTTSGLVVVDIDGAVGEESLRRLQDEHEVFPETVCVLSGNGRHFYFFAENPGLRNKVAWRPGIDLRANGGYIVGVGSIHSSGACYRYAKGCGPKDVGIAELPTWLESLLVQAPPANPSVTPSTIDITEGRRNESLTRLAGRLHNTGIGEDALLAALNEENSKNCKPPLDEEEVQKIAGSISRREVHATSGDEAESIMERVLTENFAGGEHLLYCSDSLFWTFKATHWQVLPKSSLKQIILRTIQGLASRKGANTSTLLNQVLTLMTARCAETGDLLRFKSKPPCVINCRNCEVWILDDGSLDCRSHSPQSYLRQFCDVDYDTQAKCPQYDHAVEQIFGKSKDPAEMAFFWDELAGYVMQPARPRAMIIVGKGNGSNGKTALVQLLIQMIGNEFVAALPIQDIESNRFAIAGLDGKLLLLDDDVKSGTRLPDGQLKKLSEAKIVTGEHKFGNTFQFVVRAVPVLLCNNPPSVTDLSHGLRRRLIVVPFKQRFSDDEADINLFSRIAASEMSGVLNRYLDGLSRMIARGWRFDKPAAIEDATAEFVEGANPLPTFIAEECESIGRAEVNDLFVKYEQWCQENGVTYKLQRLQFRRNLENLNYNVVHGKQGQVVVGLRYRVAA